MEKNKGGRPRKFTDNDLLKEKVDAYFDWCDEQSRTFTDDKGRTKVVNKPYTMSGLALYLDADTDTINEYQKGVYDDKDNMFSVTLKKARKKIENYAEEQLFSGNNTAGIIFNLKNNFHWSDKKEIDLKVEDLTVTIAEDEEE